MPAGEESDDHLLDDAILADDPAGDLAAHGLVRGLQLVDSGGIGHDGLRRLQGAPGLSGRHAKH